MMAPLPTYADGVPPAIISASVEGGPSISTVGTVAGSGCTPGVLCQNSSVSVSYADGNASVSGSASMSCNFPCAIGEPPFSGGQAGATFYFSVVGSKSETVPIIFTGNGDAVVTGGGDAGYARVDVTIPGRNYIADFSAGGEEPCGATCYPPFSFATHLTVIPNRVYVASVSGFGRDLDSYDEGMSFSAELNVQIDPAFADASDFKLETSSLPVGNVPEPGSLSLLGTGLLALVGLKLKRFTTTSY